MTVVTKMVLIIGNNRENMDNAVNSQHCYEGSALLLMTMVKEYQELKYSFWSSIISYGYQVKVYILCKKLIISYTNAFNNENYLIYLVIKCVCLLYPFRKYSVKHCWAAKHHNGN